LSHDKGVLSTKLHRDPATNEYELRNKFAYRTRKLSGLLQAAFMDAVCCNSAEIDFHQEARYIARSYLLAGFSATSIKQCIQQFDVQFDDMREMHQGLFVVPYDKRRQRALEHHQQQQALKKQRHTERENIQRIPYPKSCNTDLTVVKEEPVAMIPRYSSPLTMSDYLVDKKPPRHLLVLHESERNKNCAS
jgi:hypothetical protein